jgi:tetratricopeptide (TPR) repeat protein
VSRAGRSRRFVALGGLVAALAGCAAEAPPRPADPLAAMRIDAARSTDGERVGRWLLAELVAQGGDAGRAREARAKLEKAKGATGLYASLARALDDDVHGRFKGAAHAYAAALAAAREHEGAEAPLVAWFSANRLIALRASVQGLYRDVRPFVERLIDDPGRIGWRARSELLEWWSVDAFTGDGAPDTGGKSRADAAAQKHGCITEARLAGPFGRGAASDTRAHFPAEAPGPWPSQFPRDPARLEPPRVLASERFGCHVRATEAVGGGVFYVESFLDLAADREILLSVQGAFSILVDDHEVLARDTTVWGIWPRFGARLRLAAGRHRVVARVGAAEASIRVIGPDGRPLDVASSSDPGAPYAMVPPVRLADPNPLEPFARALGVPGQAGTPAPAPLDTSDPVLRYVAAHLANVEGQADMSSVLMEPLVQEPSRATGPSLAVQAVYAEKDPIFPDGDARDLARTLREPALEKDADLWWPALWLVLDAAEKRGLPEVLPELAALADRFADVPDILTGLADMYGRLGWKPERARAVKEAAARFPDDTDALAKLLDLYDEQGRVAEADEVAARIRKLDPDSEIELSRALARRDYRAAIAELERLGQRRKDRKDIAFRVADLLTRAGQSSESLEKLEHAVREDPADGGARIALADARFARGDRQALRRALVDAIQAGADTGALRDAIELVEGLTELSPFREDGRKVIAAFEASGQPLEGNAARVLDYSAIWVHEDGSARMLEHEIIHVQSREAIQEHAEQRIPQGLVLRLRTIKRDGRVLEPEIVEGKPTVTMPHLEVGDYIETESITTFRGDGQNGRTFQGPRWYFREEKLAYWRSEFVVVSPKTRPLDVETTGAVPEPRVTESGALVTRRWRVDKSPALPEEPGSAPIQEFLPSVRIGWGTSLDGTIAKMVDVMADETPRDPRLARVARSIVGDAAGGAVDERARRIYRWVLANVEQGREADPRRVIIGKSGNRNEAFVHLCRLAGITADVGVVKDRLTPPPRGPFSEASIYSVLAVRLATEQGPRWLRVGDKYAPFGYLPSSLRGQPAIVLRPGAPRETTPAEGAPDGIVHGGTVELAADGSAKIALEQRYEGKLAIALRSALETIPEARVADIVESKLLAGSLPGARLVDLDIRHLTDLDEPLVLAMRVEVASFARPRGADLVLAPPFTVDLARLAALPSRETPLYLSEQIATRSTVRLTVKLPPRAALPALPAPDTLAQGDRSVRVRDRVEGGALVLERSVDLPAGRVQPDEYAAFQAFARRAEAALEREIVLPLGDR